MTGLDAVRLAIYALSATKFRATLQIILTGNHCPLPSAVNFNATGQDWIALRARFHRRG